MSNKNKKPYVTNYGKYVVREVGCPFCDHTFMFLIATDISYAANINGNMRPVANCPKCCKKMIVEDGVFEGVRINN